MLLDSNIIIYSTQPGFEYLHDFFQKNQPKVSAISKVEVLGFHALTADDRRDLEMFFQTLEILPVSDSVVDQAVLLRQQQRMKLGDALIAATAVTYKLPLATRNVSDFANIAQLQVVNPIK